MGEKKERVNAERVGLNVALDYNTDEQLQKNRYDLDIFTSSFPHFLQRSTDENLYFFLKMENKKTHFWVCF